MQETKRSLTFGADIEFIVHKKGKPTINYATGFFGGTKQHPIQFPNEKQGFMYQEDGATLELNIPICHSVEEFRIAIERMVALGKQLCEEREFTLTTEVEATLTVPMHEVPLAYEVGCSPDWDAYTMTQRVPFQALDMGSRRYAGGHIHIGFPKDECPDFVFVRAMDYYLGEACRRSRELSPNRAHYYGMDGIYRPKDYGIEYRTLCTWPLLYPRRVYGGLRDLVSDWETNRERFIANALSTRRDELPEAHINYARVEAV